MDPQKITELAKLLRDKGDKILNSEFTFTLSGSLLRALNDSFTLITETSEIGNAQQSFQVLKPIQTKSPVFRDLQLVYDFVQKTTLLCLVQYPGEECFDGTIDISKFRALNRLEVQKINVGQIVGIQRLRSQLQQLICVKSLHNVEEIITHCGGDQSNGFVWNELKVADFSFNNLHTVDTALEFAHYLQHLNLRHNQLESVQAIKWLPHLKTLDLSFNRLVCIPQFHVDAYKRLQSLNMSNNFVEDLMGSAKLDALTDLDLSDNCLLDHTYLLPLSQLMTLKYLNLYGNPLHCHPKHRLATAQYLHKNTATVKFILDFESLSKMEKGVTGSKQMRNVSALNRFSSKSSSSSINRQSSSATHTPSSSVGSMRSFTWQQDQSYTEAETAAVTPDSLSQNGKKSAGAAKMRTVDIEDNLEVEDETDESRLQDTDLAAAAMGSQTDHQAIEVMAQSLLEETSNDHLEAKRQVETLRKKYGAEWLQSGHSEMMQSVLGIETISDDPQVNNEMERSVARQQFKDYLGDFAASPPSTNTSSGAINTSLDEDLAPATSTPTEEKQLQDMKGIVLSPIKSPYAPTDQPNDNNNTLYLSMDSKESNSGAADQSTSTQATNQTLYKSINESGTSEALVGAGEETENGADSGIEREREHEDDNYLETIYSTTDYDEPEISDYESDEETYIVYTTASHNEAIFLTLSSNFLRERDTLTQKTYTKWSLKILESCERLKSNTLRINFDTVKLDKQERVYVVEDGLCQELENKLRGILSERDLTEMNQSIYRCMNCMCQFSHENKKLKTGKDEVVRCPDCKSTFVVEVHENPKDQLTKQPSAEKLSPAAIVEEALDVIPTMAPPLTNIDDAASIGKGRSRPSAINATRIRSLMPQAIKSSVNSLNESSSCSKITNSHSSFDSNQSVAGSSNTERENELLRGNYESDVEILSNPSQSSIEVLDSQQHRSSDEERYDAPTVVDAATKALHQQQQEELFAVPTPHAPVTALATTTTADGKAFGEEPSRVTGAAPGPLAHFNLTESSSSGSVTDSICTTYEQAGVDSKTAAGGAPGELSRTLTPEKSVIQSMLAAESAHSATAGKGTSSKSAKNKTSKENNAKDTSVSSMFGAIFQSTNMLMSSSKKLLEAEANVGVAVPNTTTTTTAQHNNKMATCTPYKFNYTDFNDIDHRLKLYFYQTKFEEAGESFKWLVRGRIFNENTHTLCDGVVVVSTCKFYLLEAFAAENDDVTQWLRPVVSVTVDRLEEIQLLPWKIGLAFTLRGWGGFLLLLQDILRTDSLLLHFANDCLPGQCELQYQLSPELQQRLSAAVEGDPLKMCSILNGCEVTCGTARRTFQQCVLLTTDTRLYLTSGQLAWLSLRAPASADIDTDVQVCMTQYMSNLVDAELFAAEASGFTINFFDETENKSELWRCTFETKDNAESCLNAIGQSWEELFGVPLGNGGF